MNVEKGTLGSLPRQAATGEGQRRELQGSIVVINSGADGDGDEDSLEGSELHSPEESLHVLVETPVQIANENALAGAGTGQAAAGTAVAASEAQPPGGEGEIAAVVPRAAGQASRGVRASDIRTGAAVLTRLSRPLQTAGTLGYLAYATGSEPLTIGFAAIFTFSAAAQAFVAPDLASVAALLQPFFTYGALHGHEAGSAQQLMYCWEYGCVIAFACLLCCRMAC